MCHVGAFVLRLLILFLKGTYPSVWKPLRGPVQDWPLALCDSVSLSDSDIVPADAVYEHVVSENAMIHHNPRQLWHYLADQEASEALMFTAADSHTEPGTRKYDLTSVHVRTVNSHQAAPTGRFNYLEFRMGRPGRALMYEYWSCMQILII